MSFDSQPYPIDNNIVLALPMVANTEGRTFVNLYVPTNDKIVISGNGNIYDINDIIYTISLNGDAAQNYCTVTDIITMKSILIINPASLFTQNNSIVDALVVDSNQRSLFIQADNCSIVGSSPDVNIIPINPVNGIDNFFYYLVDLTNSQYNPYITLSQVGSQINIPIITFAINPVISFLAPTNQVGIRLQSGDKLFDNSGNLISPAKTQIQGMSYNFYMVKNTSSQYKYTDAAGNNSVTIYIIPLSKKFLCIPPNNFNFSMGPSSLALFNTTSNIAAFSDSSLNFTFNNGTNNKTCVPCDSYDSCKKEYIYLVFPNGLLTKITIILNATENK